MLVSLSDSPSFDTGFVQHAVTFIGITAECFNNVTGIYDPVTLFPSFVSLSYLMKTWS